MSYPPASIATDKTDDTIMEADHAPHHDTVAGGVNTIVTELGSNPKGSAGDLTARLTASDSVVAGHTTHLNTLDTRADALEAPKTSARVFTNGAQGAMPDLAETLILFQSESYKNPSSVHGGGSPSRLVAPTTGVYLVGATIEFATNSDAFCRYFMRIFVNGNYSQRVTGFYQNGSDPGIPQIISCEGLWRAGANDYFEVNGYHNHSPSLTFNAQFYFHFLGDCF